MGLACFHWISHQCYDIRFSSLDRHLQNVGVYVVCFSCWMCYVGQEEQLWLNSVHWDQLTEHLCKVYGTDGICWRHYSEWLLQIEKLCVEFENILQIPKCILLAVLLYWYVAIQRWYGYWLAAYKKVFDFIGRYPAANGRIQCVPNY